MPLYALYFWAAFSLLSSEEYAPWIAPKRVPECAAAIAYGAAEHGAPIEHVFLAVSWARGESGCDPHAVNAKSGACGLVQELGPGRRGHSCWELKSDPALSVRVWLEDLDEGIAKCGSLRGGLRYVSSGKCSDLNALVSFRCAMAGVDC